MDAAAWNARYADADEDLVWASEPNVFVAEELTARPIGPGTALDLACGTGVVARALPALVGPTGLVVGADVNEGMVAMAAAVAAERGLPVTWHRADATTLPVPDHAFDLVCCQQGLQFFAEPVAVLREVHRVLDVRGRLAVAMWRALEHAPAFAAFVDVLDQHVGAAAAASMRA